MKIKLPKIKYLDQIFIVGLAAAIGAMILGFTFLCNLNIIASCYAFQRRDSHIVLVSMDSFIYFIIVRMIVKPIVIYHKKYENFIHSVTAISLGSFIVFPKVC